MGTRATLQLLAGTWLGQHWTQLLPVIEEFEWLLVLVGLAAVMLGLWKAVGALLRRRRAAEALEVEGV